MRNYFFYVLFTCVFTNSFGKNVGKNKSSGKVPVKQTREFFEQEAKTDIENLLLSIKNRNFSEEDDPKPFNVNASGSNKLMEKLDKILKNSKSQRKHKKNLRKNAQINAGKFKRGVHIQNLPLNLRNAIESSSNLHNFDAQRMNIVAYPHGSTIKSKISGGHNVDTMLQNGVNYVGIKPEVYPLLITDDKYGEIKRDNREIAPKKNIVRINHQYYTNGDDKLAKLLNKINTKHNNETLIRTATIPMSENFDLEGLLNKLHIKQEVIPTKKESDTNVMLHDFLNKFYARVTNHLRPGNRVEIVKNYLDELNNIDSKHRESKTILHRSEVVDNANSNTNDNEFMKSMDTRKIFGTPRNAFSHDQRPQPAFPWPARHGDYRSRYRRSSGTQAGYTQDPDTCKTYNENLVKLWSNLSELISINDQPNDRALHNIAMMIQAYLEHQHAKQPTETLQVKHAGPRDKTSEIMLRIRKLLDEDEGSADKITKIILRYLRPSYKDGESEDCQQVNEEYLTLSVDLLYKNYLEKTDCQGEDDDITRTKKVSLMHRKGKTGKTNVGHMTFSMEKSYVKPVFQIIENQSYEDFLKGKTQRQKLINKNRRVFKPSRQQKSRPAYRSGNQNESETLNTRSKSTSKKHKKSSLKSVARKSKCEKYATRKLAVSLRPVIERFMGLLECQLDNTLRSVSFSGDSEDPYHRYASKLYSNESSGRNRKVSPRFSVKNIGRKRNKQHKKLHTERHGSSFENSQDTRARGHDDVTDSAWVRKYSFDTIKRTNFKAHAEARDTDARMSDNDNNKYRSNDYGTNYTTPHRVYKTSQKAFPSLRNPSISLNDKKNTTSKSKSKQVVSSGIGENENHYEYEDAMALYEESSISAETHEELFRQETESSTKNTPFIDLTKLSNDDQLTEEKSKIHVKTFESIKEFLKSARDESLKTPEFAVPFALDTNKGYVELTHLIKYPKILVYRPQFLVKNTMPYDDFLKTFNNSMTNDDVTLMKIVRHLPNGSVQVLFETEDSEAPLEIRNLNDKDTRRSESPVSVIEYQSENRIDTANRNNNADLTDGNREGFSPNYHNAARKQDLKSPVKSYSSSSDAYLSPDLDLNTTTETLRGNEELSQNSYFDDNSDIKAMSNSTPNSSEQGSSWSSPLPSLFANHPNPDVRKEIGPAIASQLGAGIHEELGTQIGSGMQIRLDKELNLGLKFNPMDPAQLGSFHNKLMPSHTNAQATSNPSLNSQSHMNSHFYSLSGSYSASNSYSHLNSHSGSWSNPSHSLLPNTDSNNQEVGKKFSSPTQSIVRWWRRWKRAIKEKIKQIIGKMAILAGKFDRIVKR